MKSIRASWASGFSAKNPSPYSRTYSAPFGPNSMSIGLSVTIEGITSSIEASSPSGSRLMPFT